MSRETKEAERLARKRAYRANRGAQVLRTTTLSSEESVNKTIAGVHKQLHVLPGKPEEKYMVILRCVGNNFYSYPIYGCPDGFTAAMRDAITKHQEMDRPEIEGGVVQGIGNICFNPPDAMVQVMAMGANVAVTNRLENRQADDPTLRGQFGQGGY